MNSLREAAGERGWKIQWEKIDARFETACAAADNRKFANAVRLQSEDVIELMAQIRAQRKGNASDSSVDL